jgi:hypothetical protein
MHVVILCYSRPHLIEKVVSEIICSKEVTTIDFVVDALNNPVHAKARRDVIELIERFASTQDKIICRIKVFNISISFTEHVVRTHKWVMEVYKSYLVLEEDTKISIEVL